MADLRWAWESKENDVRFLRFWVVWCSSGVWSVGEDDRSPSSGVCNVSRMASPFVYVAGDGWCVLLACGHLFFMHVIGTLRCTSVIGPRLFFVLFNLTLGWPNDIFWDKKNCRLSEWHKHYKRKMEVINSWTDSIIHGPQESIGSTPPLAQTISFFLNGRNKKLYKTLSLGPSSSGPAPYTNLHLNF